MRLGPFPGESGPRALSQLQRSKCSTMACVIVGAEPPRWRSRTLMPREYHPLRRDGKRRTSHRDEIDQVLSHFNQIGVDLSSEQEPRLLRRHVEIRSEER